MNIDNLWVYYKTHWSSPTEQGPARVISTVAAGSVPTFIILEGTKFVQARVDDCRLYTPLTDALKES